ncbi:DUF3253 domain-containing protein [Sphingomonas sp.]|uniref:DUF3253 domain-containing protein n=1 Tax=Sphingomonas sp. TaxID=28214 RepID=UPI0028B18945|nr:DUF3253 domain-containing protein [Sphingomonas sp.]
MAAPCQARSHDGRALATRSFSQPMTPNAREMALAMLAARAPTATLCPSEVARAIAPGDAWRGRCRWSMPRSMPWWRKDACTCAGRGGPSRRGTGRTASPLPRRTHPSPSFDRARAIALFCPARLRCDPSPIAAWPSSRTPRQGPWPRHGHR